MPSFDLEALWPASPHTLAKIEIVQRYLYLWFTILAKTGAKKLVYIDGFAGPGEYTNFSDGSPIAALKAADAALRADQQLAKLDFNFLFIEKKPELANHLRSRIQKRTWPQNFR